MDSTFIERFRCLKKKKPITNKARARTKLVKKPVINPVIKNIYNPTMTLYQPLFTMPIMQYIPVVKYAETHLPARENQIIVKKEQNANSNIIKWYDNFINLLSLEEL